MSMIAVMSSQKKSRGGAVVEAPSLAVLRDPEMGPLSRPLTVATKTQRPKVSAALATSPLISRKSRRSNPRSTLVSPTLKAPKTHE